MSEKVTLVVFSGEMDKALAAFNIAIGAASMGMEVSMFFTFWGLNIIKKNRGSIKSEGLMRKMVGNKELMNDFSKSVFDLLKNHGIKFRANEGCVFTPMVFETPVYAQKVGRARSLSQVQGFGPQVYAEPAAQAEAKIKVIPFPGIIEFPGGRTPGVIIHDFWWVGIPAPEMLKALDMMRNM